MKTYTIDNQRAIQNDLAEIQYIKYSCDTDVHIHDAIEVVYILSGKGEHIIDNRIERVSRGSLVIIDYGQVHSFSITEPIEYYNMLFKPAFIADCLREKKCFSDILKYWGCETDGLEMKNIYFCNGEEDKIEKLFYLILNESTKRKFGYMNFIRSYTELIMHSAVRNVLSDSKKMAYRRDEQIYDAMQYIQNNCNLQLTLADVSKRYNFSANYFSELLKQHTGLSFKQFLITKRMMKAMLLLLRKSKNYSVEEIISECGYMNKSFFYKTFKQHFGITPKDVKRYRNGDKEYIKENFLK